MGKFDGKAKEEDQGAVALVLGGLGLGDTLELPKVDLAGAFVGTSSTTGEFEGCVAEPFRTITAILPGSKVELLVAHCVARCIE